jgi:SAM-dependent methyltransferase
VGKVTGLTVDASNAEQAKAWDGDEGSYWADNAGHFDRAVAAYHGPFMSGAGITPTDLVLDIGCGTGQTTRDAARAAVSGAVLGVDLSSRMIEYARRAAGREGLGNVLFEQVDAQVHPFVPAGFDVAISRTGAMFFGDPVEAFTNVAWALRPGGRLVLLTWQGPASNEWIQELSGALAAGRDLPLPPADAPGPFSLSDPDRVRAILGSAGFGGVELGASSKPMWFGHDTGDAERFVLGLLGWMLQGLDDSARAQAHANLRATLAAHATGEGVLFGSSTWTIRATRS